jgi:two-component system, cell cycle sensor histidine kinase and response regulator CckA
VVQTGGGQVWGDATQLHQVLLNLCVNARDAMPQGGVLRVCTRVVGLREGSLPTAVGNPARPGQYVHLQVQDSGHGISPDVQEHMFEPFFSTKMPEQGTGLGLATVLGIVQGYGGFIHVSSVLNEGTTFDIYLPLAEPEEVVNGARQGEVAGNADRGANAISKGKVLVVDDEQGIREILELVLPRLQYEPLLAESGQIGLALARVHGATLRGVLVDVQMPQMDGLTFVGMLREFLPELPVLVMTGHMDENTAVAFSHIPHTYRLNKPFNEAELRQALHKTFS